MNIAFYLAHPAHYHYHKYVARALQQKGHNISFVMKEKDVLEQLLLGDGWSYTMITHRRKKGFWAMLFNLIQTEWNLVKFLKSNNIDTLVGSSFSFATRVCTNVQILSTGEDDAAIVPLYAYLVYPFTHVILSPSTCDNGRWQKKTVPYQGYMELGYLHPHQFTPSRQIVENYGIDTHKPYYLLRFSSLQAHHDKGITGINTEIAQRLIDLLSPYGAIYITSERPLEPQFEQYRIRINPLDIHHVMAFAAIYIGDSQTMAAESGVLGVPFVRFNGFVGRIGYLCELEDVYHLGYGVRPEHVDRLYQVINELLAMSNPKEEWQKRRQKMLRDKIDYAEFLTHYIENYPLKK